MTDAEFDILDELYFVTPFAELLAAAEIEKEALGKTLVSLYEKGWLRVYSERDTEIKPESEDLHRNLEHYLFLASKEGLMAHNLGE